MSPASPPRHFHFVDAMRGYAILAVIMFHVVQLAPNTYSAINRIASQGGSGVQLFFVISAFALFWSLANRTSTDRRPLPAFFMRRIFRVVPLFWLGILFYLVHPDYWQDQFAPNGVGWPQLLTSFLFVHGWYPTTINSVVPGGWSIAAEMMFYLTLPFLFRFIRSIRMALSVAMLSSVAAAVGNPAIVHFLSPHFPPAWASLIALFVFFSFPIQFPIFCWGIVLYFLLVDEMYSWRQKVVIMLLCAAPFLAGPSYILLSILFALTGWGLSIHPIPILVNRFARFVGLVSYSLYIWHFYVLDQVAPLLLPSIHLAISNRHLAGTIQFAILYLSVAAVTLLVASASYYLIERPFIHFGRWLIGILRWGPERQRIIHAAMSDSSGTR